ncbi:GTPase IMAP family member 8-like [Salarias fasciatus]|uniref:GTPase IMAP family member 8-like n=1 Tax=Salarias fasciatus TaxID=181472 RepID=UPI0011766DB0|nr:GTPase IMAP family member 8-like [Salarias fasciatus]
MESSSEVRIVLIGGRWSGKSTSANTILGRETFASGRTRTTQSEVRHEVVEGRKLVVVDAPGWSSSFPITEKPEGDKLRFRLNASKCPPGPNVFLLVIPVDEAFTAEQRRAIEEHMKLLSDRAWKYTMVLFTYGDFLGGKTVEEYIESEGEAIQWLIEKCKNRYHVFNNKDKSNATQVPMLLDKIDEMVQENKGGHYEVDEHTLKIAEKRQEEVAKRAEERQKMVEEDKQLMMKEISENTPLESLQMVLLGSRSVGKTSVVNTILGFKEGEEGKRTGHSMKHQGVVGTTKISVVDTPGWWKEFSAYDTPEAIKDEVKRSVFLCPPGPHVFLLVIDADTAFNGRHLKAVTTHLELLGDAVWKHTIVVFTRGDWLESHTIEQHIEGEGEALQSLVERCGNRYHVLNNKDRSDAVQVKELLDKITGTAIRNSGQHYDLDEKIFDFIEDRRRRVEEGASLRLSKVRARKDSFKDRCKKQRELRLVMLGQKTFGKTTSGNNILCKDVFAARRNDQCQVEVAEVAGRLVTVIDTPGWREDSFHNSEETDKEIVRGLSLSPSGVHAVLLVIPLDLKFRKAHKVDLEEYMDLFEANVWKHAMVLFTHGDKLVDKSVEEYIESEHRPLLELVEKCNNRYHVINNLKKHDTTQVTELLEKIEEMVAENRKALLCPNTRDVQLRIEDKSRRRQIKNQMRQQMEQEISRRKHEWLIHSRDVFLDLQADLRGSAPRAKPKLQIGDIPKIKTKGIVQKKKDEKEDRILMKISQEIEKLDQEILVCSHSLRSSKEFNPPDMRADSPAWSPLEYMFDRRQSTDDSYGPYDWSGSETTLNFSQSSGYRSEMLGTHSYECFPDD